MDSALFNIFIFLTAACVVVPLTSRFKLGSVLGYLTAGIVIGPFGLGLIGDADKIMHFAEFGVVMMLFLIGLELEPVLLWRLRKSILGLGGLQVVVTSSAFDFFDNEPELVNFSRTQRTELEHILQSDASGDSNG